MKPEDSWLYEELEPEPETIPDDPRTQEERLLDEMYLDWDKTRESVRP